MLPKKMKLLICIAILMGCFFQISLAEPAADAASQNPLDQFIIATMRILFAFGLIIAVIALTLVKIISILPWWVLVLISPFALVILYFASIILLHVVRRSGIPSKIGEALRARVPTKLGYKPQFADKAFVAKKRIPSLSHYLNPGFAMSWILGDVEKGKISWQLFTMGALVTLGTSIGIIIFLFGHLSF